MNWISYIFRRKRDEQNILVIGGERLEIKPVGLQEAVELILIIAPYVPLLERAWPEFQAALQLTDGRRPEVLVSLFRALAQDMQQAPGDMTRIIAILLDKPVEWVAENVTGQDVMRALSHIDRINRFDQMLLVARQMVSFE